MMKKYHRMYTIPMRTIAIHMVLLLLVQISFPTCAFALTSGPTQPEASGFTPIGTSEMVNVFTGDFNYNIPLLDVGGYPINISYQSGVGLEDEASWVGLGWSLNVGSVVRNMRGLPDDFNGDMVETTTSMRPTTTVGISGSIKPEILGYDTDNPFPGSFKKGIYYNNYNGFGIEKSWSIAINAGEKAKGPLSFNLGLSSDTQTGATVNSGFSLTNKAGRLQTDESKLSLSVGSSYNSRAGIQSLTLSAEKAHKIKINEAGRTAKNTRGATASFETGMPTYTPSVSQDMINSSVSGRVTLGLEILGLHTLNGINVYWSQQKLGTTTKNNEAYGYMYAEGADQNSLLDFNRDNDGAYLPTTPALPLTNFTYDVFSVTGQGSGGSFRAFRGDVGHVYDAKASSQSNSNDFGVEFGNLPMPSDFHGGASMSVNSTNSTSGRWAADNNAVDDFSFKSTQAGELFESYYFKEAGEANVSSDTSWVRRMGGYDAVKLQLTETGNFSSVLDNTIETISTEDADYDVTENRRDSRENRNALMYTLTVEEVKKGYGLMGSNYAQLNISADAKNHHIGEIVTLNNDGMRYVYAIPLYNNLQEETTFAIETGYPGGHITYDEGDDSPNNENGRDHYFSRTTTPAYAHSYMLTAVLSPDYVDSDNVQGPSPGDMGSYTLFTYSTGQPYQWRTPMSDEANTAAYNRGVLSDPMDDKASYVYGQKELRYLQKIETKTHVALFETEAREDARGVTGRDGEIDFGTNPMVRLNGIRLFTRAQFMENELDKPLKEVHFVYDYTLCQGVPNSTAPEGAETYGKLTLKALYFTYQGSKRGALSPYAFQYHDADYTYGAQDRWGNYKECPAGGCFSTPAASAPGNDMSPYTRQDNSSNVYARSWLLHTIELPSGGKIEVDYESDDYAYVQNRKAKQMFPIVGACTLSTESPFEWESSTVYGTNDNIIHFGNADRLLFELSPNHPNIEEYFDGSEQYIYLKVLSNIPAVASNEYNELGEESFDYVPVYINPESVGTMEIELPGSSSELYGYIDLSYAGEINPISRSVIQFGQLNAPRILYEQNNSANIDDDFTLGQQFLEEYLQSIFDLQILDLFSNTVEERKNAGCGQFLIAGKSWVRMDNPTGHKKGGGVRVRRVKITDNWSEMAGNSATTSTYGQQYSYTLPDGTSSGVASYEPQIGGDENPFKTPAYYEVENMGMPDQDRFLQKPFGECFFPSPVVGYSRVVVQDILGQVNLSDGETPEDTPSPTGYIVQEFYTAKDFPTIVQKTGKKQINQKTNPLGIFNLLNFDVKDFMTVSQGFLIETNDMHGKQKAQYVFSSTNTGDLPISSVVYEFQSEAYGDARRLVNEVKTIDRNGNSGTGIIGVNMDLIHDFRQEITDIMGAGVDVNTDVFTMPLLLPFPLTVPTIFPKINTQKTKFRSSSSTKVVHRFGVQSRVIATDNTSVVSTRNLAYDAVTGQVLATETINNYDDPVYTMTYPAHWYYDQMGPAFKNIGFYDDLVFDSDGWATYANATDYFVPGDEVSTTNQGRGWVEHVEENRVRIIRKNGSPLIGSLRVKILRSGRKNLSTAPISQLTTLVNPIENFSSNIFEGVLQASAVEYEEQWQALCDCAQVDERNFLTSNGFVLGTRGNWRPVRSYTYLTGREQAYQNRNTNIRKDGIFTSYFPFYFVENGVWDISKKNWTYASEVTEFSPYGIEIENRDALGRYSSAQFGFSSTLPVAVAANARHFQIGFTEFEDQTSIHLKFPCSNEFQFSGGQAEVERGHTGGTSLRVTSEQEAVFRVRNYTDCVEEDCVLTATHSTTGSTTTVTLSGATGGITLSQQVLTGNPTITSFSGSTILISGTGYATNLLIRDASGCETIYHVQVN